MTKSENTKDIILDAFEDYVLEVGTANFTLEGVAKHAGVSKGGLLYHFPSKKDLLQEMIDRAVTRRFEKRDEIAKTLPDNRVRMIKAHIKAWLDDLDGKNRLFVCILTSISHYPDLLEPLKEKYESFKSVYCEQGMDETVVDLILLAVDGYLLHYTLGTGKITENNKNRIQERLLELCDRSMEL